MAINSLDALSTDAKLDVLRKLAVNSFFAEKAFKQWELEATTKRMAEQAPKPVANRKGSGPRQAASYRGARRNAWHADRRRPSKICKQLRCQLRMSRSEFDRMRHSFTQLNADTFDSQPAATRRLTTGSMAA